MMAVHALVRLFGLALIAAALVSGAINAINSIGAPPPIVIDEPDQIVHPAQARVRVCEKRALPGRQHTLNPNAPPHLQRQETVKVCVQVPPDGSRPPGPILTTVERKPRSIA